MFLDWGWFEGGGVELSKETGNLLDHNRLTFLPRIWLMAADSLSVHSATTWRHKNVKYAITTKILNMGIKSQGAFAFVFTCARISFM